MKVQYGDTVVKGTEWGYSGEGYRGHSVEGYSIGIQWRRVQSGDAR